MTKPDLDPQDQGPHMILRQLVSDFPSQKPSSLGSWSFLCLSFDFCLIHFLASSFEIIRFYFSAPEINTHVSFANPTFHSDFWQMSMPWVPILIQSCPVASFHLTYRPLWYLFPFFLHLLVLFLFLSSILIFHSPFYFFFSSSFYFNHLVLITTRACLNPPHQLHPSPRQSHFASNITFS